MTERNDGGVLLPLVNGGSAIVSAVDAPTLKTFRWRLGTNGYVYRCGARTKRRACLLHRIVTKARAGQEIHHRNGNKIDCRRENLEITTATEHQSRHRETTIANNRSRRQHPLTGVCKFCEQTYTKDPDHRGRQTCCCKHCAISLATKTRMEARHGAL